MGKETKKSTTRTAQKGASRKKVRAKTEVLAPISSASVKKLQNGVRLASARMHNRVARQKCS